MNENNILELIKKQYEEDDTKAQEKQNCAVSLVVQILMITSHAFFLTISGYCEKVKNFKNCC